MWIPKENLEELQQLEGKYFISKHSINKNHRTDEFVTLKVESAFLTEYARTYFTFLAHLSQYLSIIVAPSISKSAV